MSTAVRGLTVAAVVAVCALPSAAANVFPRLAAVWDGSAATPGNIAMILLLVVTALLMAACPFAVNAARKSIEKLLCVAMSILLAAFNFSMAHETIGKLRDSAAAPVRELQAQSAALNSRIEIAARSRKE